jgi:hypothetical protein
MLRTAAPASAQASDEGQGRHVMENHIAVVHVRPHALGPHWRVFPAGPERRRTSSPAHRTRAI